MKSLDNGKDQEALGPHRSGKKYYYGEKSFMKRKVAKKRRRADKREISL